MTSRDQKWEEAMEAATELSQVMAELGIEFSGVLRLPEEQQEGLTALRYMGNLPFSAGIRLMAEMVISAVDPKSYIGHPASLQSNSAPV